MIDGQGAPPRGPLWSIPTSGGSPRKLGDMVAETASWSRDAGLLAYANRSELFLAKGDGTEPRKLLSVTGDIRDIQWSPDNAHLRFDTSPTAGGYGQQMMLEVSTQGKDVHQLLPGWHKPPDECCGRWTPDGPLCFASKHQIWALPRRGRPFSAPKPVQLTSSPLLLSSPLPDKNGKKLLMVGQTDRGELTRYDLKSGQFTPFLGGTSVEYVNVSQDGQWAAFVTYPQGNLWRSRMDGTDRMQLTFPPLYAMMPRWSPQGGKIAFFVESGTGKPAGMYEILAAGGTPRRLAPSETQHQKDPNWSPDGSRIVFGGEANDPASSIRVRTSPQIRSPCCPTHMACSRPVGRPTAGASRRAPRTRCDSTSSTYRHGSGPRSRKGLSAGRTGRGTETSSTCWTFGAVALCEESGSPTPGPNRSWI